MELSRKDIDRIKDEIPLIIGKNIRKVRMNKGLSQTDLANLIQSDRQYLYKIEHGKVGLTLVKLVVISKALDIPVAKLMEGC